MKTPFFIISKKKLNENLSAFQSALKEVWPNSKLSYSVKTNSLPWILKYLKEYKVMAEVVSDEEYQLARLCGYLDNEIIFNGPIKGEKQFEIAIDGNAYINLDSYKDLEYLKKYKRCTGTNIGIRLNIDPSIFNKGEVGYKDDGFRFGFSEENNEFKKSLDAVYSIYGKAPIGLHLHCNSITRSLSVYKAIARCAVELVKKYDLKLSFIDMGGGYFGGVEGKSTPVEYIIAIKNELIKGIDPKKTKLIIEPGSAIIGSVIDLHTSVLDVKDTKYSRIVTTDGSRIHIDPLWGKSDYKYSLKTKKNRSKIKRQIVCGYTCMDHDRIMILEDKQELGIGEKVIYHRVGAYSMTFGGMFIRYLPDVYVEDIEKTEKVRGHISVEDFYNIHSEKKIEEK